MKTTPLDVLLAMRRAFERSLTDSDGSGPVDPARDDSQEAIGACGCYRTRPCADSDSL